MEQILGDEKLIVDTLTQVSETLVNQNIRNNDTKWTRDIRTALCELGYSLDYNVYTSKANDHDNTTNECLYDMIWFTPEDENNRPWDFKHINMALESEWSRSFAEIKYDFYKLIQCRAKLRVMIFQASEIQAIMNPIRDIIQESTISLKGDKYLLAGWNDEDGFTFELVIK